MRASSGAFVIAESEPFSVDVHAAATTLDALLAERVAPGDRALLKLDIEGHELEALRGAASLLDRVEVVVSEVRFLNEMNQREAEILVRVVRCVKGPRVPDVDEITRRH
jgi:hypothetical protein